MFTYGAESPVSSQQPFQRMNSLFNDLGPMASPKKDVPPCHHMLCLGIWINTLDMTLSVPSYRISELHQELRKSVVKQIFVHTTRTPAVAWQIVLGVCLRTP